MGIIVILELTLTYSHFLVILESNNDQEIIRTLHNVLQYVNL